MAANQSIPKQCSGMDRLNHDPSSTLACVVAFITLVQWGLCPGKHSVLQPPIYMVAPELNFRELRACSEVIKDYSLVLSLSAAPVYV